MNNISIKARILILIAKMQEDGVLRNHEIRMRGADGRPIDIMFTILPITYGGQPGALG